MAVSGRDGTRSRSPEDDPDSAHVSIERRYGSVPGTRLRIGRPLDARRSGPLENRVIGSDGTRRARTCRSGLVAHHLVDSPLVEV